MNRGDHFQLGVTVTGWSAAAYEGEHLKRCLDEASRHGFTHATFTPAWYLDGAASALGSDPELTPTDTSVLDALRIAGELGLRTVLKPHVDLRDFSLWRGHIEPADRAGWWQRYEQMVDLYADVAQAGGAALLVLGTELERLTGDGDAEEWRRLAHRARTRFDGALTYTTTAHHDISRVRFWDALDYIGVNFYAALGAAADPDPTREQLTAAWSKHLDALQALHDRWHRPVLIAEIGYRSAEGALHQPWNWERHSAPDRELQAVAYDAAYAALGGQPWIAGLHWWDWPADLAAASLDPTSYSPHGKPAAAIARTWNATLSRRARPEPVRPLPFVSVVIPVRNGEATIRDCVQALLAADYPAERMEIVVVDNASNDRTAAILGQLPVRYVREPTVGRSHARNRGIVESVGEIVAFTDADCIADRAWLRELVSCFERERAAGVAGEILADPPQTAAQRFMAERHPRWQSVVLALSEPFAITANLAFRRSVFTQIGMFDPGFVTAEDVDFGWRFFAAGLTMAYCPEATVSHRLRPTTWQLLRQQEGLGYGRVLLRERYNLRPGYAVPAWDEIKLAAADLVRTALSRPAQQPLTFALYELIVSCSLRAGALRRDVERSILGAASDDTIRATR